MLSRRSNKQLSSGFSNFGCHSILVLAKLGFDLRDYYEPLVQEPFPEEFTRHLDRLDTRGHT
jgi:hypothetical protein